MRACPAIPARARRCRVHRIPPRVRDDREPPLWDGTAGDILLIWVRWQAKFRKFRNYRVLLVVRRMAAGAGSKKQAYKISSRAVIASQRVARMRARRQAPRSNP